MPPPRPHGPAAAGAAGSRAARHVSGAPPGAGCGLQTPLFPGRDLPATQWEPRAADAVPRGWRRSAGCEIRAPGWGQHLSLLPAKPKASVTVVASPGEGPCSTHGWGRGTGKLALSSSTLSRGWRQGGHILAGRIRCFYGLSGASFLSLFFFFSPSLAETCSFVIGRFIVFPSDISLIT